MGRSAHIPDLIEEQGAALGLFELALPLFDSTGEGAFLVAEQLAFDQFGRNGRTVHFDEGCVVAGTQFVKLARDELFARAIGAGDEHPRIGRCDGANQLDDLADGRRISNDGCGAFGLDFARQPLGFLLKLALIEGVAHGQENAVEVQRLLDEVKGAHLDGLHRCLHGAVAADHDDAAIDSLFHEGIENFQAVHFGHFDVTKDHIKGKLGRQLKAFRTVLRFHDLVILVLEDFLQARSDGRFIIDDENFGGLLHGQFV